MYMPTEMILALVMSTVDTEYIDNEFSDINAVIYIWREKAGTLDLTIKRSN